MPDVKVNVKLLWIQFEDVLAPAFGLTVKEFLRIHPAHNPHIGKACTRHAGSRRLRVSRLC